MNKTILDNYLKMDIADWCKDYGYRCPGKLEGLLWFQHTDSRYDFLASTTELKHIKMSVNAFLSEHYNARRRIVQLIDYNKEKQ